MSAGFTETPLQRRLQAEIVLARRKQKTLAVDGELRGRFHDDVPTEARLRKRIAHAEHGIAEAAFRASLELCELDIAELVQELESIASDEVATLLAEAESVVKGLDRTVEHAFAVVDIRDREIGAPILVHAPLYAQVGEADFAVDVIGVIGSCQNRGGSLRAERLSTDAAAFGTVANAPARD